MRTHHRTCPLCEATCGVAVTMDGDQVVSVRGDADDVFSHGFICPKGVALRELHHDPDRLRHPLVRDSASGELRRASWDEAFAVVRDRLGTVLRDHGPDSVAVYLGNPNSHNVTSTFYAPAFLRALGTSYRFSASTVDQMPKQVSAGLMFGTELSVPIPDIDRTDVFLVLGANPMVSNGSLFTVPDFPGRLRALHKRGGRMIVVDPVRTRTAAAADEHLAIRPGSDALWLAAIANAILSDGAESLGAAEPHVDPADVDALRTALRPFTAEAVANATGIDARTTRRVAGELVAADAAVYGRMGTTTTGLATTAHGVVSLGAVASWLVDVVNVLAGSLDRPGGVMWPRPPAGGPTTEGTPGVGRGTRIPGSRRTRVRGLPSAFGEFPVAALAEEIDTPDPETGDRVRALVTIAGNPVLSTPDGARLERSLAGLDVMVALDAYVTETSRHADVVLPAPSPLARRHYDVVFGNLAIRNTARWADPSLPLSGDERDEGETLLQLAAIAAGARGGGEPTVEQMDDLVAFDVARRAATDPASRAHGRDPSELLAAVGPLRGLERLLDLRLRSGPYGDGFGAHPDGITLADVQAAPHGLDFGPMKPRLPEVLRTPSGRIELAPPQLLAALSDAEPLVAAPAPNGSSLVLVGRRQLRSNNSWLHNLASLTGGSNRCTLLVNPGDSERLGLQDGGPATVTSDTATITATVSVTDDVRPGVVCLPHGWGHAEPGTWGVNAREHAGVNVNVLAASQPVEALSGNAVLAGYPVQVRPG